MKSKREILAEYFQKAKTAENYLLYLDRPGLKKEDIEEVTGLLDAYNKQLAAFEDAYPWIANVLIAMEGN